MPLLAAGPVGPPRKPPAPARGPETLGVIARAYRESPGSARRAAVEAYAKVHARETEGALARLVLGIVDYEQRDYAAALEDLRGLATKLPRIADYAAYYQGAAEVEATDFANAVEDLLPVHRSGGPSPFAGRAWVLEARALKLSQPAEAVRLLREHYGSLPQPDGDINLADCYQAAGDLAHAADFYQRIYYERISGDASARAAAALITLKDTMSAAYPEPLPQQRLRRAELLLEARALKLSQPAEAVRLLREHYSSLPEPDGDINLADCYQAAGDLPHAADFYQRVYFERISGDPAARAAAALITLKDAMGAAYPEPLPQQRLRRADLLFEAREYPEVRREYETLGWPIPTSGEGDQATSCQLIMA